MESVKYFKINFAKRIRINILVLERDTLYTHLLHTFNMLTTLADTRTSVWIVDKYYSTVYSSPWIRNVLCINSPDELPKITEIFPVLPELISSPNTLYPVLLNLNHHTGTLKLVDLVVVEQKIGDSNCFVVEIRECAAGSQNNSDWSDITLFEDSPIPIWDEDFSHIKIRLDELKKEGVTSIRDYLTNNLKEFEYIISLLIVNRINKAVVELNEASSKEEVLHGFRNLTTEQSFEYVLRQLEAIWNGETSCEFDASLVTMKGNLRYINLKWTVVIGNETTYKHIYLTTTDLTNRIKEENKYLQRANKEKETLLKEVHHRVKNNLQIITSLIRLQLSGTTNETAKNLLKVSLNRINSIASVHELLYKSNQFSSIDYNEYIRHLVDSLVSSMVDDKLITVEVDVEPVHIPLVSAIPLGLLINEIITNSIKHAFPNGTNGKVFLHLKRLDNKKVLLRVGDNGTGFRINGTTGSEETLGLSLIENLAEQLSGELHRSTVDGTIYELRFEVAKDTKLSLRP